MSTAFALGCLTVSTTLLWLAWRAWNEAWSEQV